MGETDGSGYVYHANFFRYAEMARHELFRAAGFDLIKSLSASGLQPIIAEAHATFHGPLHFDDAFDVVVSVLRIDSMSWSFSYAIARADKLRCADLVTVHGVVNADYLPVALPDGLREVLRGLEGAMPGRSA